LTIRQVPLSSWMSWYDFDIDHPPSPILVWSDCREVWKGRNSERKLSRALVNAIVSQERKVILWFLWETAAVSPSQQLFFFLDFRWTEPSRPLIMAAMSGDLKCVFWASHASKYRLLIGLLPACICI
jgi:hypothetical protein